MNQAQSPASLARQARQTYWNRDEMISFPVDPVSIAAQAGVPVGGGSRLAQAKSLGIALGLSTEHAKGFASELIMPAASVLRRWAEGKSITWLQKHYDVAEHEIISRLVALRLR